MPVLCGGSGMYIEAVLKGYKLINVPVNNNLRQSLAGKSLAELSERLSKYKKLHNTSDVDTVKRAIRAIEIEEYYLENPETNTDYPNINSLIIGIDVDREIRRKRISERLKARLNSGMIDEVQSLMNNGLSPEDLIYYGLEYKYITQHLIGKLNYNEMFNQLEIAIHQFAKRQMTWFRRMEKQGFKINWIDGNLTIDEKVKQIIGLIS
jgi:tRNA dimethylallyltransferase